MDWELFDEATSTASGPFSEDAVVNAIERGLSPRTLVRPQGKKTWKALTELPRFAEAAARRAPQREPAPAQFGAAPGPQPFMQAAPYGTPPVVHAPPSPPYNAILIIGLVGGALLLTTILVVVFVVVAAPKKTPPSVAGSDGGVESDDDERASTRGRLTKAGAKKLIKQRQQTVVFGELNVGAMARCRWSADPSPPGSLGTANAPTWAQGKWVATDYRGIPSEACFKGWSDIGKFRNPKCETTTNPNFGSKSTLCAFEDTGAAPKSWMEANIWFTFECGTQSVGDVLAVFTTGNTATVQFAIERKLNRDLLDKIASCKLELPKEREVLETRAFRQDDEGNWSIQSRETLGL